MIILLILVEVAAWDPHSMGQGYACTDSSINKNYNYQYNDYICNNPPCTATCSFYHIVNGQPIYYQDLDRIDLLQFSDSIITKIPTGIFSSFRNTKILNLGNLNIENIDLGAFHSLTHLRQLDLSNNKLRELEKGVLNNLSHLSYLNISNNILTTIENKAFFGTDNLNYLYISNNNLTESVFDSLCDLQLIILDMSHNFIKNICNNLFSDSNSFNNLIDLDLSFNLISYLNCSFFRTKLERLLLEHNNISVIFDYSFSLLRELDLSNNRLSKLFNTNENLIIFNVSSNQIKELNDSTFTKSQKLEIIDLSNNLIIEINEDIFLGLSKLKELYLQNNKIINFPLGVFSSLNSLTILNFSCNKVKEIYFGTFGGLSNLSYLDISNNSLAYLLEVNFHNLPNLRILNIKNNFITKLDFFEILKYSKNLHTISLNGNPWYCKFLLKTALYDISIDNSSSYKSTNVYGISCRDSSNFHTTANYENSESSASHNTKDFKNIFNKIFLNSSFYHFFNDLNNTSSVTYTFWKTNFSNLLFNISKNVEMLDKTLNSVNLYSKSNENSKVMLHYLDEHFQNSTFYKVFNKFPNFSLSSNTENLYPILLNISNQLQYMKETSINDFKNFSFFKLYENKSIDDHEMLFNKFDEELSKIVASKYLDNSQNSTPNVIKSDFSYSLNKNNTLLIIVIIILLIFGVINILSKIYSQFNYARNKVPTYEKNRVSYVSELELN